MVIVNSGETYFKDVNTLKPALLFLLFLLQMHIDTLLIVCNLHKIR